MSRNREYVSSLSHKEKELTALGAAMASNCIPCLEYHIPQARKAGLTDPQIREAVELAVKVRQVPADKVRQTAFALLAERNPSREENPSDACGCTDAPAQSGTSGDREPAEPCGNQDRLENRASKSDNEGKGSGCRTEAGEPTGTDGADDAAGGSRNPADQARFDVSKMMEMMQGCCPDKMKDITSVMPNFAGGCRPASENDGSKKPGP